MANRTFLWSTVLAAVVVVASACAPDAVFRVVHPAALPTADYGNTYSIGTFDGVNPMAAGAYRQLVVQAIQHSLNSGIRLASGSGMVVSASVSDDAFETTVHREDAVCNCAYANGTDPASGQRRYIYQNTPCIALVREAHGSSVVTFSVTDSSGGLLFSNGYSASNRWEARALSAPNCQANPPNDQFRAYDAPQIDRMRSMAELYQRNGDAFSRVILPWSEDVSVDLESCGRDARCARAKDALQAGNLEMAVRLYSEILAPYENASVPVPENEANRVAEALYNRGVVLGYSSDYVRSVVDLERACQMRPNEDDWRHELDRIRTLANEHVELSRQAGGGATR